MSKDKTNEQLPSDEELQQRYNKLAYGTNDVEVLRQRLANLQDQAVPTGGGFVKYNKGIEAGEKKRELQEELAMLEGLRALQRPAVTETALSGAKAKGEASVGAAKSAWEKSKVAEEQVKRLELSHSDIEQRVSQATAELQKVEKKLHEQFLQQPNGQLVSFQAAVLTASAAARVEGNVLENLRKQGQKPTAIQEQQYIMARTKVEAALGEFKFHKVKFLSKDPEFQNKQAELNKCKAELAANQVNLEAAKNQAKPERAAYDAAVAQAKQHASSYEAVKARYENRAGEQADAAKLDLKINRVKAQIEGRPAPTPARITGKQGLYSSFAHAALRAGVPGAAIWAGAANKAQQKHKGKGAGKDDGPSQQQHTTRRFGR